MNLKNFSWNENSKKFKRDSHALFGASKYHWINYSIDKMLEVYSTNNAKRLGTELHAIAADLIKHKLMLENTNATLNQYVNDSIVANLRPEQQLYYSEFFYGTADAIGIMDGKLRIHDLKTGKVPANMKQLYIYAAFFMLEYGLIPKDFKDIELRIYQNNDALIEHPKNTDLVTLMDKIVTANNVLEQCQTNIG